MSKQFDFVANEKRQLAHWDNIGVFDRMVVKNAGSKKRFRFVDGPVTANAAMCMHHVWGRTLKSVLHNYHTMTGHSAHYQNGFDAQGMWVEVEVEKELGLKSKRDIADFGLANFTEKCMARVRHFGEVQTRQNISLGLLMDWKNSHFTNSDGNITSIWHFLKVCHGRGLLRKSYKSMPWCPRCGTSLSEHEMSGSYKEVTHRAVFAKFHMTACENGRQGVAPTTVGESLLIWTTTPWTLPANVAVAVNPEDTYLRVRVKSDKNLIIVGEQALKKLQKDVVEIVSSIKGSELLGKKYIRPFEFGGVEHGVVIPWSDVSAAEGSGLVHIAPGCGAEDFELGKLHSLEPIVPIDESGQFRDEFGYLKGIKTDDAADIVFDELTKSGMMYYTHPYTHNYPFCWRCKTDVVFRLVDGWDIATADVKPAIFAAIETVDWQPAFTKKMMIDWITNMGDWNISRRRFYGLPLPFYPCECGELTVVGSLDELRKLAVDKTTVDKIPHLHRPYIDEVKIKCTKCARHVERVPDVGDCWLDAGIMPFSTKKYATDRKFWHANFPSDVVVEMKEQIRLWYYAQLFMSVVLEGRAPYKCVYNYSTMLDEDGKKFSKTGPKNIPLDWALENYGADSMRYVFASANPALDMRFGPSMIDDARRKMVAFMNTVNFYELYTRTDKPKIDKIVPHDLDVTDVWLVEAMNEYIRACDKAFKSYNAHQVVALTEAFVDQLSNFYIRANRRRFWKSDRGQDKDNAYWVLYTAIRAVTVIQAIITPFLGEHVWQMMFRSDEVPSVMLADFPRPIKLDKTIRGIGAKVEFIQSVTTLAHSLRARENLKVRQPLRTLYVKTKEKEALRLFDAYLREELNVKEIRHVTDEARFNTPYLVVNFKVAGRELGGRVQELKDVLANLDDEGMKKCVVAFDAGKIFAVGNFRDLKPELFTRMLKSRDEFVSETQGDLTVVLDTTLDAELVAECKLRELIRAIQVARQDADLDITARIELGLITKSETLADIIHRNSSKIREEVLARTITDKVEGGYKAEADIDGDVVVITFKVVR